MYISQPVDGVIYFASRSHRSVKLLWRKLVIRDHTYDTVIDAHTVPKRVRHKAYKLFERDRIRARAAAVGYYAAVTLVWIATAIATAHAQTPTLQQVYGPATVTPGCRAHGCGYSFNYVPPFLRWLPPPPVVQYDPAPQMMPQPLLTQAPLGWVYGPYTLCTDQSCNMMYVNVAADGLNVRANGPE